MLQRGRDLADRERAARAGLLHGWREFYAFSFARDAEASTFWYMGHYLVTVGFNGGAPPAWAPSGIAVAFLLLGALGAVAWLALLAPVKPRLAQLAFLTVLGVPAHDQGVEPAVLDLVGAAGRARPSALAAQPAVAVQRGRRLDRDPDLVARFHAPSRGIDYGWLMLVLLDPRRAVDRDRGAWSFARSGTPNWTWSAPTRSRIPAGGPFDGALDHPVMLRVDRLDPALVGDRLAPGWDGPSPDEDG